MRPAGTRTTVMALRGLATAATKPSKPGELTFTFRGASPGMPSTRKAPLPSVTAGRVVSPATTTTSAPTTAAPEESTTLPATVTGPGSGAAAAGFAGRRRRPAAKMNLKFIFMTEWMLQAEGGACQGNPPAGALTGPETGGYAGRT